MDTRNDIALAISAATGMDAAELLSYIEIPPDSSMGVPPSLKFSWKCLYNKIRYLGEGREAVSRTASRRRG